VIPLAFCIHRIALLLALFVGSVEGKTPPDTKAHRADRRPAESTRSKPDTEHYSLAKVLARAGLYEDALREVNLAISIDSRKGNYYDLLGYCLEALRRHDDAIRAFDHALVLNPHDAYARRERSHCLDSKKVFEKAGASLESSVSLKPFGEADDRWLGEAYTDLYRHGRPADLVGFDTNYSNGISAFRAGKFEEAAGSLGKAVELKPEDFDANFWRGMILVRARKFSEAIPNFEKAHEIRHEDKASRLELFACYLATQQPKKAVRIFPLFIGVVGGALTFAYFVVLGVLLPFSVRVRTAAFPGLRFSLGWLALFFEGQIAFLFLLTLLPSLKLAENALAGLILAGLPVIVVAMTGFARQPWGEPFRWPLRFGTWRTIAISLLLLLLLFTMSAGFSELYVQITHKPAPLQHIIPLIKGVLQTNPLIAWAAVPVVIPVVEEVLFRGLFYGALEKRWGIKGAILGSAFLFSCVHLQFIGFFYLFCFGLILGWARWQSRSLGLPIAIHSLNNATAMLALTLSTVNGSG
jgi:membrane protease YdiL (CAAX protease family)/Flp pilus assembly protein TadD